MHPYAKEQIDSQVVPKSLERDVLLPPNPELKVVYVVPIRGEIQNGNFFFLLRDFVEQTASKADFEALFVVNNSKDDVGSEAFFDNQLILEVLRYIDGVTSTLDVPMKDWERALVERAKLQKLALYAIDFSLQGTFPKSKDGDKIEKARTIGDNVAVSRLNQTKIGGEGAVVVFDADGRLNRTATQGIVEQLVQDPNLEMIKIKYDFIPGEGGPEIFETTSRQRFLVVLMELIHFGKVRVGGWFATKAKSLGQRDPDVAQPKERDRRHESLINVQRADNAAQFYTKDRAQDPDAGGLFSVLRYFGIHSQSQSLNFFRQNIEHPAFTVLTHIFQEDSTQRNNPLVRQFVLFMFDF